jgi:hypothetical protein
MMKMFRNEVKEDASAILAAQIAEFKMKGGVVRVVKAKRVKISQFTCKPGTRAGSNAGQNDVLRLGSTAVATV